MKYFAYGSNMSLSRIKSRISSAVPVGTHYLPQHNLCFHKASKDGSGKCDAFKTKNKDDFVWGRLYEIDSSDKEKLDGFEGLGYGYEIKDVIVFDESGLYHKAFTYYATDIDENLIPYSWYKQHVIYGAQEAKLSDDYIEKIKQYPEKKDTDNEREKKELAIYNQNK